MATNKHFQAVYARIQHGHQSKYKIFQMKIVGTLIPRNNNNNKIIIIIRTNAINSEHFPTHLETS